MEDNEEVWVPKQVITVLQQFHDGMMVLVLDDGDTSEPFPVTIVVKQGCVLAPALFSMVFAAMLTYAFQNYEDGIPLRYRTNGRIFNSRRLQAITKVKETVIRDFLFVDDCALNASTEEKMQHQLVASLQLVTIADLPLAVPKLKLCIKLLQASPITIHVS